MSSSATMPKQNDYEKVLLGEDTPKDSSSMSSAAASPPTDYQKILLGDDSSPSKPMTFEYEKTAPVEASRSDNAPTDSLASEGVRAESSPAEAVAAPKANEYESELFGSRADSSASEVAPAPKTNDYDKALSDVTNLVGADSTEASPEPEVAAARTNEYENALSVQPAVSAPVETPVVPAANMYASTLYGDDTHVDSSAAEHPAVAEPLVNQYEQTLLSRSSPN